MKMLRKELVAVCTIAAVVVAAATAGAQEISVVRDVEIPMADGVTLSADLEKTSTKDWQRCMFINARAPFILCREALGLLRKSPAAYIVNIASVVGVKGYPQQSAYTSSKHALRGMSISLAEELRGTNVRVHVICPGGVDTDMVSWVRPDIATDELIKPDEIAELVLYLVTHKGNAVVDEIRIRRATSTPWF